MYFVTRVLRKCGKGDESAETVGRKKRLVWSMIWTSGMKDHVNPVAGIVLVSRVSRIFDAKLQKRLSVFSQFM